MYTLRTMNNIANWTNNYLGETYYVQIKQNDEDAFAKIYYNRFKEEIVPDNIHALVVSEDGKYYFLEKRTNYYIVSKDGSTFMNMTCK